MMDVAAKAGGVIGGVLAAATLAAFLSVGSGQVPSTADLRRVEAKAEKIGAMEVDVAVLRQRIETIEKTTGRIEEAQAVYHREILTALERRHD